MQKFFNILFRTLIFLCLPFAVTAQKRVDWQGKTSSETQQTPLNEVSKQATLSLESFEDAQFPPNGWRKFTQFGGAGWQRIQVGSNVPGFQNADPVDGAPGGGNFVAIASWVTGDADSILGTGQQTAQWLITPQIKDVQIGDSLIFYLKYFSTFGDNLEILLSTATPEDLDSSLVDTAEVPIDSVFTIPVDTLVFTETSSNEWTRYSYSLADSVEAGANIFIAFKERVGNTQNEGDALFLDLVEVPQVTSVSQSPLPPDDFRLHQNFPNPFNPSTSISFSLPVDTNVTLSVHNLLGQVVATILDAEPFIEGTHVVKFDASELPNGIYFYKILTDGGFSQVKKMTLLK